MSRHRRADGGPGTLPADLTEALAAITARLVNTPDNASVLRLITEVGTDLLGASATGVLLVRPGGGLDVVAASDGKARFLESLQTDIDQGPCVDSIASATLITSPDLSADRTKWPDFVPAALAAGFRSAVAVPMRLDERAVGGFNLLYDTETVFERWQLELGQVVADLAVLALVQERGERRADRFLETTVTALNDRVQFGQAVGVVAGTLGIEPAAAHAAILGYATEHALALRDVTGAITDGSLDPANLT
ncbi:response regulator [Amycolatopsis sp. WAC 01376]|uniref:GAF domain-containing protein n=1 Tax=Amycolatopsis sp. WAC 01376 TaxID=2203195 RepID=UPI000F7771FB|nr:GAF and ANTAR domain-containing protein [Amycolatopsis sp. WAC 01376]RSM63033.1 response regulator [Amycolatopsis sp. WAC 01376]